MRKFIVVGTALAILVLSFVVFKVFSGMEKPPEPAKAYESVKYVNAEKVVYSDHRAGISANGRVRSSERIEIYPEVNGLMMDTKPDFKTGSFFPKGSSIIKIDDREIRLTIKSLRADFLNAITQMMPDIKSDFPGEFSKWKSFLDKIEIDSPLPEMPSVSGEKEKYFIAGRNILKLYYNIKNQELRLEKHEIKAPFDGVVIQSMAEPGTFLRVGMKAGEFAGIGNYEIELPIPETEIAFIDKSSPIILFDDSNGKSAKAFIKRISKHIDPGTQTITIFAGASASWIKDGMYLRAEIGGKDISNSVIVPRSAIYNNSYVHLIENSKLTRKKVEVVYSGENKTYIRGIEEGAMVITDALVNAALGIKVKAIEK